MTSPPPKVMREHGNRESTKNDEHRTVDSECRRRTSLRADLFDVLTLIAETFPPETKSLTLVVQEGTAEPRALTLADVGFVAVARFATGAIRSPIMPWFHTGRCARFVDGFWRLA